MNALSTITRATRLGNRTLNISRYLTAQHSPNISLPIPLLTQSPLPHLTQCVLPQVIQSPLPQLTQFTPLHNPWIWQQNDRINFPIIHNHKIELPNGLRWIPSSIELPINENIIEAPSKIDSNVSKQAARLIIIRRKKMKKHKLKKLRKRMKFEWAKLRQRRELKKEKAFQAVLIQQCKDAEAFSAEKYVQQRIDKLNEIVIPRYWKGKRLPEFLIREKMGLPPKK